MTKWVKKRLRFCGYFDLYNIPFEHVGLYDFTERKSPLKPGGMNKGSNIFDLLTRRRIPYFVSNPDKTEEANWQALLAQVRNEAIDFAFLYWPALDGLLHRVGNDSAEIDGQLALYETWISQLVQAASRHFEEVRLYVFSDHGMANCDVHLDLKRRIEQLPLAIGRDYAVVYDSTMARFWFFSSIARRQITQCLQNIPDGRILSDDELQELGAYFEDRYFGELIYLVREGVLIVPSHMGERPIRAMHGYHPSERHSYAAFLTNQPELPVRLRGIENIFTIMALEAEGAFKGNKGSITEDSLQLQPA